MRAAAAVLGAERPYSFALVLTLAFAVITVLSVVPGSHQPSTVVLPDSCEHVVAYLLLGMLSMAVARRHIGPGRLTLALGAYACLMELAQFWVPDRTVSFIDILASVCGAGIGVFAAWRLLRAVQAA